jgi:hypothetical protein
MSPPEGEGGCLEADASNRGSRIARILSRVDTEPKREHVEDDDRGNHDGDEQQATHRVTILSLAPVWYSQLGQGEMYLD